MQFLKDNFKKIRKMQRWSVQALAKRLNLSPTTIHMWESGHHEPPVKKIYESAELFNVPVKELMFISGESLRPNEKEVISAEENIKLIDSLRGTDVDNSMKRLNSEVVFLEKRVKELSLLVNTLLQITPVPFYIKDTYQQYVLGNKAFYEMLNIQNDFVLTGKKDEDIFPETEAKVNSKEDASVLHIREPVRNREDFIPGTRKRKWGDIYKLPILGAKSSLLGVMGIFVDITRRKEAEGLRLKLEKMLHSFDETIWMGKGTKRVDGNLLINEFIYMTNSPSRVMILKDKINLPYSEQVEYFRSLIVEDKDRKRHDYSRLREGDYSEVYYKLKVADIDYPLDVRERIYYNEEEDLYVGAVYIENSPYRSKK